nr:hypothetical protein [Tanacetum cinerariifolium]
KKADLKQLMKVVPDEEEVAIDAIPLNVKENLKDLYKLIKARYGSTRPVEDLDLLLCGDLKTMFEPHVEDEVWKLQQRYKVVSWKLYDSCGVHCLSLRIHKVFGSILLVMMKLLMKKLDDSEEEYQVWGRIVGIKSHLNTVGVTTAQVEVSAAQEHQRKMRSV